METSEAGCSDSTPLTHECWQRLLAQRSHTLQAQSRSRTQTLKTLSLEIMFRRDAMHCSGMRGLALMTLILNDGNPLSER